MKQKLFSHLSAAIGAVTHRPFAACAATPAGGGSINQTFRLEGTDGERYFLKLNDAAHLPMFVAEVAGLDALAATNTLRVPQTIAHGIAGEQSYLVLEYLELGLRGDDPLLGAQLAALHRCKGKAFGFSRDNFIGSTPQPNGWRDNWVDFWREHRLGFQLQLAAQKGLGGQLQNLGGKLLDCLPAFFEGYAPQPSLLHGDLWSGNHAFTAHGAPAIFDPAVYYGDRECDIAMTELFGGFPASFHASYRAAWPLHAGYETRRDLYNLYHILNHANLFGGGYVRQAEQMLLQLLVKVERPAPGHH
ncbi:MAG: fructosamine kinase family protein [Nitrosomonadales bacterium]|nr:fructosamine kinase family protein [Nitrosomonadales bacterium]